MAHEAICVYRPCRAGRTLMHYAVPKPIKTYNKNTNKKQTQRSLFLYTYNKKLATQEL
jgi:hypothetical protein